MANLSPCLPTLLTGNRFACPLAASPNCTAKEFCEETVVAAKGYPASKAQPQELASARCRCEATALARPCDGSWSSSQWFETRKRLIESGQLGQLRTLVQAAQLSTEKALRRKSYVSEDAVVVDLSTHLSPTPAICWYGRENVYVPEELVRGASSSLQCMDGECVEPPLVVASSSVFEVISQLTLFNDTDVDRKVLVAMEVSDFESDGTPSVNVMRVASPIQQGLMLCSDFGRFAEASTRGRMRGAACTVRDHLSAAEDPYVFVCLDLTVFRGPQEDGYPFLERPCRVHAIITAMPTSRPALSIANTSDSVTARQTEWYACESDQRALLERLNLIGLIALQEHTPNDGKNLVLVINALGCDRGLHPRDAVANSLKHWRRRFARFFHCVIVACGPDEALARHFDSVINHHVYACVDNATSPIMGDWHWDERYLRLHVNSVEFIRFGALCQRSQSSRPPSQQPSKAPAAEKTDVEAQQDSERRRSSQRRASLLDSFSDADAILESSRATRGLTLKGVTHGDEVTYMLRNPTSKFGSSTVSNTRAPSQSSAAENVASGSAFMPLDAAGLKEALSSDAGADGDGASSDDVSELVSLPSTSVQPLNQPRRCRRPSVVQDRFAMGFDQSKRKKSLLAQRVSVVCRSDSINGTPWRRFSHAHDTSRPLSPTKSANLRAFAAAVEDARHDAIEKFDEAVGMRLKEQAVHTDASRFGHSNLSRNSSYSWLSSGSLLDVGALSQSRSQGSSRRVTGLSDTIGSDSADALELRRELRDRLRLPKHRDCSTHSPSSSSRDGVPSSPISPARALHDMTSVATSEALLHVSKAVSESDDQSGGNEAEDEDEEEEEDMQDEVDEQKHNKKEDTNEENKDGQKTDGTQGNEVPGTGLSVQALSEITPAEAEVVAAAAGVDEAEHFGEQPVELREPFSRAAEQRLRMELDGLAAQIRDHSMAYWSTQPLLSHLKKRRTNRRTMARKLALHNQDACKAGLKGLEVALAEDRSASSNTASLASRRKLASVSVLIDRQIDRQVECIGDLQPSSTRSSATGSASGTAPSSPTALRSTPLSPRTKGCRAAQLAASQLFRGPFGVGRRDSAIRSSIELPEDLGERNFAFRV
mmetsp:Transcript_70265/g.132581  ORF Transcript_70265/g.132581 Transcript_70265/m.132581 type:complete len:1108 (+) Transcript_70265:72-3395(+)